MILLKCSDLFYLRSINSILTQKKIPITIKKSEKHFFELNLFIDNTQLKIASSTKSSSLNLPISFELIFSEIKNHFVNKFIRVGNYNYEPINQSVSYNEKIIFLNYIHNVIFTNLILNIDTGIDKNFLYRLIWTQDKDIQINKLDTHITNLKNKIKKGLDIDLKIVTNSGILRLSID